jgi:hypothetical protein
MTKTLLFVLPAGDTPSVPHAGRAEVPQVPEMGCATGQWAEARHPMCAAAGWPAEGVQPWHDAQAVPGT